MYGFLVVVLRAPARAPPLGTGQWQCLLLPALLGAERGMPVPAHACTPGLNFAGLRRKIDQLLFAETRLPSSSNRLPAPRPVATRRTALLLPLLQALFDTWALSTPLYTVLYTVYVY
jgi:hypothetical protein